jgi:hypothetical protein
MSKRLFNCIAFFLLAFTYYVLRIPTSLVEVGFLDDYETLYHVFSVIQGKVPYRDDYHHHFMGYLLPYLFLAKFQGFDVNLLRQMAFLNQVATGFVVYLCLGLFVSRVHALIGGLLVVSAREPFVLGFFMNYQSNLLVVLIWYFCFAYLKQKRINNIYIAGFITGLLVTYDQRFIFSSCLPFAALWLAAPNKVSIRSVFYVLLTVGFCPISLLSYLALQDALIPFFEQCFIFPMNYRVASQDVWATLINVIYVHRYLLELTPYLLFAGLWGFLYLFFSHGKKLEAGVKGFIFISLGIQFIASSLGGRDYEYYTIPYLVILPLLAVLGSIAFDRFTWRLRGVYLVILSLPVMVSIYQSLNLEPNKIAVKANFDGSKQTIDFLKSELKENDTFFVWGYRFDLYVRTERLSAYPFANLLMIQPDQQVRDLSLRNKHIYHKYQKYFFDLLSNRPPSVIVVATRNGIRLSSPSQDKIEEMVRTDYTKLFSVTGSNIVQETTSFEVYRKKL